MPRGYRRSMAQGRRFVAHSYYYGNFLGRFGLYRIIDLIFLLLMLYLLFKLFLVASTYVIALVLVYIIWGFISPRRHYFGPL